MSPILPMWTGSLQEVEDSNGLPLFSWAVLAEDIQKHLEEQIYGGETGEKEQFYSFQLLP